MPALGPTVGATTFEAELHEDLAPRTCAALRRRWPLRAELVQARWSGEAAWVPLGDLRIGRSVLWEGAQPLLIEDVEAPRS